MEQDIGETQVMMLAGHRAGEADDEVTEGEEEWKHKENIEETNSRPRKMV